MDSRVAAELIPPVYEEFDPSSEMVHEKDSDTILLNLPGFRKDHLKVQLTTSKILRVSGSRQAEVNKWRKFQKEFPVTPDHDTQKISAKFEGDMLYIRLPKGIPPARKKEEKHDSKVPATDPREHADQHTSKKNSAQEQASNEKPAQKDDSTKHNNAENGKEEQKAAKEKNVEPTDSEKKAKKSPDLDDSKKKSNAGDKREDDKAKKSPEEKPRGLDDSKDKSTAGDKPEDDRAKKSPEQKPSGLDDSKKKSIAGDEREDDSKKATEKRDRGSGKSRAENSKETAEDLASKLKKHRRMFNFTMVLIMAFALGIYITDFIKSLRRSEN